MRAHTPVILGLIGLLSTSAAQAPRTQCPSIQLWEGQLISGGQPLQPGPLQCAQWTGHWDGQRLSAEGTSFPELRWLFDQANAQLELSGGLATLHVARRSAHAWWSSGAWQPVNHSVKLSSGWIRQDNRLGLFSNQSSPVNVMHLNWSGHWVIELWPQVAADVRPNDLRPDAPESGGPGQTDRKTGEAN